MKVQKSTTIYKGKLKVYVLREFIKNIPVRSLLFKGISNRPFPIKRKLKLHMKTTLIVPSKKIKEKKRVVKLTQQQCKRGPDIRKTTLQAIIRVPRRECTLNCVKRLRKIFRETETKNRQTDITRNFFWKNPIQIKPHKLQGHRPTDTEYVLNPFKSR